jgi:hypothetical protein
MKAIKVGRVFWLPALMERTQLEQAVFFLVLQRVGQ